MFFDTLMFDQSTLTKLEVYHLLAIHDVGEYGVHFFGEQLRLNYHQMTKILGEIDEDLRQYDTKHYSYLHKSGKVIISQEGTGIDEYRNLLLKKSIPFQFILETLATEKINVEEFCTKYDVGRSTLSRKMAPLAEYFKNHHLRLSYSPIDIVGDEALVRQTIWYLLWVGTRGLEWPFSAVKESEKENLIFEHYRFIMEENTFVGNKEIELLAGIIMSRWRSGKFCQGKWQWRAVFENNPRYANATISNFDFPSKEIKRNETHYLLFLGLIFPHYESTIDPLIDITIDDLYTRQSSRPNAIICRRFMDYIYNDVLLSPLDKLDTRLVFSNILGYTYSLYCFGSSYPSFQELSVTYYKSHVSYKRLLAKVTKFFDEIFSDKLYADFFYAKEMLITAYTGIIMPYYFDQGGGETVKVGIALERDKALQHRVRTFLGVQSYLELLEFDPKKWEEYDFVITSSSTVKNEFPELQHFVLDLDYGVEELVLIYQRVQQIWQDRMYPKRIQHKS
jgi:hypothetical protein